MRIIILSLAAASVVLATAPVFAGDEDDMAEMQKRLNDQVMQKPFSVEDAAKVDAYVQEAMKKDLKPRQTPPKDWRPGYTCNDLWRYSYNEYRDCVYYHRYYGRYW
jgi:hypothetical protein